MNNIIALDLGGGIAPSDWFEKSFGIKPENTLVVDLYDEEATEPYGFQFYECDLTSDEWNLPIKKHSIQYVNISHLFSNIFDFKDQLVYNNIYSHNLYNQNEKIYNNLKKYLKEDVTIRIVDPLCCLSIFMEILLLEEFHIQKIEPFDLSYIVSEDGVNNLDFEVILTHK